MEGSIRVNINQLFMIMGPGKWDSIGMTARTVISLKHMDFMLAVFIECLEDIMSKNKKSVKTARLTQVAPNPAQPLPMIATLISGQSGSHRTHAQPEGRVAGTDNNLARRTV